ncbi:MAG: pentapeptide repeat-containing protein [Chloroflexota bacterium]
MIQPPKFSTKLHKTRLTDGFFQAHEEYSHLRIEGGHWAAESADSVMMSQVQLHEASLDASTLYAPKLTDVRLTQCNLANTTCERIIAHRTEWLTCQLIGLNVTEGHFQNVVFRDCHLEWARFRFCSFKAVTFEACNLKHANFQGADLSGVRFKHCDLSEAEMSQAKLVGTDFRTSTIEGIRVGATEVVGAVVDHMQAAYMASLLGLVIKSDDEV